MKTIVTLSMAALLSFPGMGLAQSGAGKSTEAMKGVDPKQCAQMMKGMDMQQCAEMMKGTGMDQGAHGAHAAQSEGAHEVAAVVKAVDRSKGTVTLAHQPIPSLNWPAMTMDFAVKNKILFDKLTVGKQVQVELTQQGRDYVVTAVK